jgi:hypothetical protein
MPPEVRDDRQPCSVRRGRAWRCDFVSLPGSLYRRLKAEDDYLRFTSVSSSDLCPAERTPLRGDRLPGWRGSRSKSRAVSVTVSSCTDSCAESHMRLLSGCLAASPCQLTATLRRPSRAALVPQCHLGGTCMPGMAPARLSRSKIGLPVTCGLEAVSATLEVHQQVTGPLTHPIPVGCAVIPAKCTRRVPCSVKNSIMRNLNVWRTGIAAGERCA